MIYLNLKTSDGCRVVTKINIDKYWRYDNVQKKYRLVTPTNARNTVISIFSIVRRIELELIINVRTQFYVKVR